VTSEIADVACPPTCKPIATLPRIRPSRPAPPVPCRPISCITCSPVATCFSSPSTTFRRPSVSSTVAFNSSSWAVRNFSTVSAWRCWTSCMLPNRPAVTPSAIPTALRLSSYLRSVSLERPKVPVRSVPWRCLTRSTSWTTADCWTSDWYCFAAAATFERSSSPKEPSAPIFEMVSRTRASCP